MYIWNFQVYRGKEGEQISPNGLSYDVVMDMVSGLENQGYRIINLIEMLVSKHPNKEGLHWLSVTNHAKSSLFNF